jgi:hypothetical protein
MRASTLVRELLPCIQPVEPEQLGLIFGKICPASMGNDQLRVHTSYIDDKSDSSMHI